MNIMAFRGSLGNYMAVMLLCVNGMFRFSIYPTSLGGKSIKLFTFAAICPGLSGIHTGGKVEKVKCKTHPQMMLSEGGSSTGWDGQAWIRGEWILRDEVKAKQHVCWHATGREKKMMGSCARSRKWSQLFIKATKIHLTVVSPHCRIRFSSK